MSYRAQKILIRIVRNFFNKEKSKIYISKKNIPKLDKYIKETSMDGIAYLVLQKKSNAPQNYLEKLKQRFYILKESYNDLDKAFEVIKRLSFKKVLLKENVFKYTENNYKKGTRYSCDIDFFVPTKNIYNIYKELQKNTFYTDALDINKNKDIVNLGSQTNKDISKYPLLKNKQEINYQKKIYKGENYNPIQPLKKIRKKLEKQIIILENIVNIYKKFETNDLFINKELTEIIKSISQEHKREKLIDQKYLLADEIRFLEILQDKKNDNLSTDIIIIENTINWLKNNIQDEKYHKELKSYSQNLLNIFNKNINKNIKLKEIIHKKQKIHTFYKNGVYIDIHFNKNIFYNKNLVNININNLSQVKLSKNLYSLAYEDSIIIDACHFTFNLDKYKCKRPNDFQGFLKYITDLLNKIQFKKIDWEKIVSLANKTQSSPQVWFYLKIAKKYLNADIPNKYIEQLKNSGYKGQIFLLSLIPKRSLLFNKSNIFVKLYSKCYLENGIINKFMQKMHYIYNKIHL